MRIDIKKKIGAKHKNIIKVNHSTLGPPNGSINLVNMLDVRLRCGHFNKKLQHLHKNLHIWLQSQDVVPKALASPDIVVCKVKNGQKQILM